PLSAVPAEVSVREQRPFRFSVHKHAALYPLHAEVLERVKWQTTYTFPLSTSITQLGAIAFMFRDDVHLGEQELGFIQQVADQVALAIENAQNFQQAQTTRSALERRNAQQAVLLKLTNYLVSNLEFKELLQAVATGVRRAVPCACVSVVLPSPDNSFLRVEALDFPDSRGFFTQHYVVPMEGSMTGKAFNNVQPIVLNKLDDIDYVPSVLTMIKGEGFKAHAFIPFSSRGRSLGVITLASREE